MRLRLIADRFYWQARARVKALQDRAHDQPYGDWPFISFDFSTGPSSSANHGRLPLDQTGGADGSLGSPAVVSTLHMPGDRL